MRDKKRMGYVVGMVFFTTIKEENITAIGRFLF